MMGETLILHEFWSSWDGDSSANKLRTFPVHWQDGFLIKGFIHEIGAWLCSDFFVAVILWKNDWTEMYITYYSN